MLHVNINLLFSQTKYLYTQLAQENEKSKWLIGQT